VTRALLALAVIVGASSLMAAFQLSHARAQELAGPSGQPDAGTRERAREIYQTGLDQVEAGRWADALEAFRASYRLSGVGAALFNAATALRALGRNVEARNALERLLAEHDDLEEPVRVVAAQMRDEVSARIAVLELVRLPDTAGNLTVRLDASVVPEPDRRPLEIESDPGLHRVTIESPTEGRFAWEGNVAEGQRIPIEVELEREGGGIPWWVFASGSALIVAGAIVVIAVVAATPEDPQRDAEVVLP